MQVKVVLNYAVNGTGVGHISRLVAINRHLRAIARESGNRVESVFLTTSEAVGMLHAENFGAYKIPSNTTLAGHGLGYARHSDLARKASLQLIKNIAPDLLIVDTFPGGAYEELPAILPQVRHKALIYRPVKSAYAKSRIFQAAVRQYDYIGIPETQIPDGMIIPEQMQMNVECFGPIMIRDHSDTMSWSEARSYLGVEPAQKIAYVTAGGGGDEQAHKTLLRLVHAVTRAGVKPFIGAGPLYKGPRIYEAGSVWLSEIAVIRLMNAFDFAISAAGYNSFSELMYMGVPTIFYAQERIADSQGSRARKAAATGAALFVENIHTANLREAIENILRDAVRKRLSRNARELVPENYASHCAASLYRKFLSE